MGAKERFGKKQHSRSILQAAMGSLFVALLGAGWFFPVIGYFIPLCMVAGVGMATVRGRQWCNWYCPRGSFADTFLALASPKRIIPSWLRSMPTRIAVLAFLMLMLTYQIVRLWPDFMAIGGFFVLLLTITTIVGILLALLIHQRSWCYICPIGTLSMWVGKNRHKLAMNRDACVNCKTCAKVCPMQLAPQAMKDSPAMANSGDCLKCGLCAAVCPKDALSFPQ
jgi:ferredoxin-type protein NapH